MLKRIVLALFVAVSGFAAGFGVGDYYGWREGNVSVRSKPTTWAPPTPRLGRPRSQAIVGASALSSNIGGTTPPWASTPSPGASGGIDNIALGRGAGGRLTSGSNNIDIGDGGCPAGQQGGCTESNTIRIGDPTVLNQSSTNSALKARTFIAGITGAAVANGAGVVVNGMGQLGVAASSRRYKERIRAMGGVSRKVMQLRPVTFRYKHSLDPSGTMQYGLIAEEVAKIMPELVVRGQDGKVETVKYNELIPILLSEVQRQARDIQTLRATVHQANAQAQQIEALTARLVQLEAAVNSQGRAPAIQTSCTTEPAL